MFVASIGISLVLGRVFNNGSTIPVAKENHEDKSTLDASQGRNSDPTDAVAGDVANFPAWFRGPPDAIWCSHVRDLPPYEQISYVLAKLKELNPGFDGKAQRIGLRESAVAEFYIFTDEVADIRPVSAFRELKTFYAVGREQMGKGKLTDISPLAGLGLGVLFLHGNPNLQNFEVVKGMRGLLQLEAGETKIDSVDGLPTSLKYLTVSRSAVRDLTPLRKMTRLDTFNCLGCAVESLEPLSKLPVEVLYCDYQPKRDEAVLRRMPRLFTVNHVELEAFLKSPKP